MVDMKNPKCPNCKLQILARTDYNQDISQSFRCLKCFKFWSFKLVEETLK